MKTREEIKVLESAIYAARRAYVAAIVSNLKEMGEAELNNDNINENGLTVTNLNYDGDSEEVVVDKVRYANVNVGDFRDLIEVHVIRYDGEERDTWWWMNDFIDDCQTYIFDNIKWKE